MPEFCGGAPASPRRFFRSGLVTSEKHWSISRENCNRKHFIGDTNDFYSSVAKEVEDAYMSIEVLRLIKVRANLEPAFREQLMRSPMKFLQEYDLTEDEKSQIILPNFGWLLENKLAAMAYPESEDAFTLLYQIGIRAILNLSEAPLPYETPNKIGMLTRHIPVADFTAPTLDQVKQAVAMISSCLERHLSVAVHCVAGLGRTGTILACYLVGMEIPANNAISIIREWRAGSIEVPEQ